MTQPASELRDLLPYSRTHAALERCIYAVKMTSPDAYAASSASLSRRSLSASTSRCARDPLVRFAAACSEPRPSHLGREQRPLSAAVGQELPFESMDRLAALGWLRSFADVGSSDCFCQQRTHNLELPGRHLRLCNRPLGVGAKIWTGRVTAMGNSLGDRMSSGSSVGPTPSGRCPGYPHDRRT